MSDADELIRAIRRKCMDCSGRSVNEVRRCRVKDCPLYDYRYDGAGTKKRHDGTAECIPGQIGYEAFMGVRNIG